MVNLFTEGIEFCNYSDHRGFVLGRARRDAGDADDAGDAGDADDARLWAWPRDDAGDADDANDAGDAGDARACRK